VRGFLVAFLEIVVVGAFWAGFALLGLAVVAWLLDWGHLVASAPRARGPRRAVRLVALAGVVLAVVGAVGVALGVGG
jgi:hypothetical protein